MMFKELKILFNINVSARALKFIYHFAFLISRMLFFYVIKIKIFVLYNIKKCCCFEV